jgi:hypothetical protein
LGFSSLLFPDLLALPDFIGVACRPSERELGDGHWVLSLVSRYERHRILAWIHRLNGGTACSRHRRVGRLSGVLKNTGEYFPAAQRASANSIIASGLACGPAFGMLLGGVLMSRFGWRSFFVVLGYSSTLALRRILAE